MMSVVVQQHRNQTGIVQVRNGKAHDDELSEQGRVVPTVGRICRTVDEIYVAHFDSGNNYSLNLVGRIKHSKSTVYSHAARKPGAIQLLNGRLSSPRETFEYRLPTLSTSSMLQVKVYGGNVGTKKYMVSGEIANDRQRNGKKEDKSWAT